MHWKLRCAVEKSVNTRVPPRSATGRCSPSKGVLDQSPPCTVIPGLHLSGFTPPAEISRHASRGTPIRQRLGADGRRDTALDRRFDS
jgi:hypothetical protein